MRYYAVRKGIEPGIYMTWEECKDNVYKYPGAVYKSFKNKEDAEKFLNEKEVNILDSVETDAYAFIDGSFNSRTGVYGYGGFIVNRVKDPITNTVDVRKYIIQGCDDDEEMVCMKNVAGEICGCMEVAKKAISLDIDVITIIYDYSGIEKWATGEWNRNKDGTRDYYNYMQAIKDLIKIKYLKVEAHTKVPGNEEADFLAKDAVGIYD